MKFMGFEIVADEAARPDTIKLASPRYDSLGNLDSQETAKASVMIVNLAPANHNQVTPRRRD